MTTIATAFDPRVLEDAEWADCPIWVDLIDTYGHPFSQHAAEDQDGADEAEAA